MQTNQDIKPGDVVRLNSGGSAMTVESVDGDQISVAYFAYDQQAGRYLGGLHRARLSIAAVHLKSDDVGSYIRPPPTSVPGPGERRARG